MQSRLRSRTSFLLTTCVLTCSPPSTSSSGFFLRFPEGEIPEDDSGTEDDTGLWFRGIGFFFFLGIGSGIFRLLDTPTTFFVGARGLTLLLVSVSGSVCPCSCGVWIVSLVFLFLFLDCGMTIFVFSGALVVSGGGGMEATFSCASFPSLDIVPPPRALSSPLLFSLPLVPSLPLRSVSGVWSFFEEEEGGWTRLACLTRIVCAEIGMD